MRHYEPAFKGKQMNTVSSNSPFSTDFEINDTAYLFQSHQRDPPPFSYQVHCDARLFPFIERESRETKNTPCNWQILIHSRTQTVWQTDRSIHPHTFHPELNLHHSHNSHTHKHTCVIIRAGTFECRIQLICAGCQHQPSDHSQIPLVSIFLLSVFFCFNKRTQI